MLTKENACLERAFHTITSGTPVHILAKLHFVWRDNPLPDRYVLELVSLASEILNHGEDRLPWSLHVWVDDARLFRQWTSQCHPTLFKEMDAYVNHPDQRDLRGYLNDLWHQNWWNEKEYAVKTLCEHVLSCVSGKKDFFEGTASEANDFLDAYMTLWVYKRRQSSFFKKALNKWFLRDAYFAFQDRTVPFTRGNVWDALRTSPAIQSKVRHFLHGVERARQRKKALMPEEVTSHLSRLQKAKNGRGEPILTIHQLSDLYADFKQEAGPFLVKAIADICQFERVGLKNLASLSDIDRKVILRQHGGVYSDFDGIQLAPLTYETPCLTRGCVRVPVCNNDPYFSDVFAKDLWDPVLYDIAARYQLAAHTGMLDMKRCVKKGTIALTGPGAVCLLGAHHPLRDVKNVFHRLRDKQRRAGGAEGAYLFSLFTEEFPDQGRFRHLNLQYILSDDSFKRVVMFDGSWAQEVSPRKIKTFEAEDLDKNSLT
ncbi:hypothetical protein [Candidatus Hepatobacter penaei]|uniref:hypothetical protein n=1 Tax=Candidatus Hepatobacter penaei TaxID=1274402 RepID=UPI0012E0C061|nr:hypothetical protein [Candidatus Hepatobacter penaei]